ncbi:hypothetical protein ACFL67_00875 [candidate division KSB1 bacterium]
MIIKEIKEHLNQYTSKQVSKQTGDDQNQKLGGLSGKEVYQILRVTAQVQAVEEALSCLSNQGFKGSGYRDLINAAQDLGFDDASIETLREFNPHLPFFIHSLGPHLVNVLNTYLSTKYFKNNDRTDLQDKDAFYSYYRTSTGLGLGLSAFSALSAGRDAVKEVFKVALGFPDASSTVMPQHLGFPEMGLVPETSALAAQADTAAGHAMAIGPLLRSSRSQYAEDSIVHVNIGDSGMNEPTFPNAYKLIRRHFYQIALHYLDRVEIESAFGDHEKEKDIYKKLQDMGLGLRFASHIYDNKIGISASSEVSQSFDDPLHDYIWMEKNIGMLKIFRYDSLDFIQTLQQSVKMMEAARQGPVMAHVQIIRTGGHSLSNYYGFSMIPEKAKASPIPSLTLDEVRFHNNNDSLLNALRTMMDLGYLSNSDAVALIDNAQKDVISKFIELIPEARQTLPKTSVVNRWAYTEKTAQDNWNSLIRNKPERDRLWKTHHMERVSKTPGLRFKREEGIDLPEDMDEVTPIQAENFSLADVLMMSDSFRAVGEDIIDIRPSLIEEVEQNPGHGTGGINKATAGLQALAHIKNKDTGRYHVLDIGIDESGIYALGAGMSRSFGGKGFVMCEMQFNDYDFGLFAPEEISSIYQRSNGQESLPVVIRQSYGFVRGRTIKGIFEKGGAAGVYHSACHIGNIANRFKGMSIVVPNTTRAIQMAYRNAASGETPTVILMSNPAMRSIAIGEFPYTGKYIPLDSPLDPLGTYYKYAVKGDPVGAHNHIILTYGEYAPICHYIAEKLYETGIKTLVVDYNYIVPRNENVPQELMEHYRESSIKPKFTIVSQEGDFGFGDVILKDIVKHGLHADIIRKKERVNQWLSEWLTFPTPEVIFNHILEQHRDEVVDSREMAIDDVPLEFQPMAQYFAGF